MLPSEGQSWIDAAHKRSWHIEQRDAIEALSELPPGSVDLITTDLPYESLEKHRAKGTTTRLKQSKQSSNAWFGIFPNKRFPELFAELYRVLAKDRHCYLFCDDETSDLMKVAAVGAGFKYWKRLVWVKPYIGMGYHYRARYEFIIFLEKGKRKLADLGISDVIEAPIIRNGYPAEKPTKLNRVLVQQSTSVGELVLDPFCGSGSAGHAALAHNRRFLGFDVSETAFKEASIRLLGAETRARAGVPDAL